MPTKCVCIGTSENGTAQHRVPILTTEYITIYNNTLKRNNSKATERLAELDVCGAALRKIPNTFTSYPLPPHPLLLFDTLETSTVAQNHKTRHQ